MSGNVTALFPRAVRPAPDPLGLYLRPGRNDHGEILNLIASGDAGCFGAVFDPTFCDRHAVLREQITAHRLDAILDPRTQPAATPGGYTTALGGLPWGRGRPHVISDFGGMSGRRLIGELGDFVLANGFTQVMAPTHILRTADDPWLLIDVQVTRQLRDYLDRSGGSGIPIIYSLAVSNALFRAADQRQRIIEALHTLPITELWLKVDGFGAAASPTAARTYIAGAAEFHVLGIPVVADQIGGVIGLSLLAFGAVGGIAHGITLGERFDASAWRRPPPDSPPDFGPHRRVYVPAIDAMLKPKEARALIEISARTRGLFACNDTRCCPRGARDMLEKPGRHFLYQRIKEISGLSQIPEELRPQRFLDQHLRAATDKALTAATINWGDEPMADAMAKKMQDNRKRLDNLRIALGNHAETTPPESFAQLPKTRASREGW